MSDKIHHINLLKHAEQITTITKECYGKTKEEVERKMNYVLEGTLKHLSTLNVLPKELYIHEDNFWHQLDNGKIATYVTLEFNFWDFLENSFDDQARILSELIKEKKRKITSKKTLVSGCLHKHKKNIFEKAQQLSVKGDTKTEVLQNLKNAIWKKISFYKVQNQPIFKIEISNVSFIETPEGYVGTCIINIEKTVDIDNQQKNSLNEDKELEPI